MPGARHFSALTVWKLADEVRVETFKLTSRPRYARDLKAQSQTEDAANSICRNIAEGFGCETHPEFARFLGISRRSLNELQDAFRGAQLKGYVTVDDCARIRALTRRLYPALNGMLAYLRRTPDHGKRHDKKGPKPPPPRTDEPKQDRTDKREEARTHKRQPSSHRPASDDLHRQT